jgi:hypothetical protein
MREILGVLVPFFAIVALGYGAVATSACSPPRSCLPP